MYVYLAESVQTFLTVLLYPPQTKFVITSDEFFVVSLCVRLQHTKDLSIRHRYFGICHNQYFFLQVIWNVQFLIV